MKIELYDPNKVIEFVRRMMQIEAEAKSIKITYQFKLKKPISTENKGGIWFLQNIPSKQLPIIEGCSMHLKQILINLVKNAIKFTESQGQIKITATFDFDESQLEVEVADNGVGIEKQDLDRLFKTFGKLRATEEMNSQGIGLGLMISKSLVEAYGGNINVSSPGKHQGSTF